MDVVQESRRQVLLAVKGKWDKSVGTVTRNTVRVNTRSVVTAVQG